MHLSVSNCTLCWRFPSIVYWMTPRPGTLFWMTPSTLYRMTPSILYWMTSSIFSRGTLSQQQQDICWRYTCLWWNRLRVLCVAGAVLIVRLWVCYSCSSIPRAWWNWLTVLCVAGVFLAILHWVCFTHGNDPCVCDTAQTASPQIRSKWGFLIHTAVHCSVSWQPALHHGIKTLWGWGGVIFVYIVSSWGRGGG